MAKQAAGLPRVARARQVDDEARAFLRIYNRLARRPVADQSLEQLRRGWHLLTLALGRRSQLASVTERSIDTPAGPVGLRIFVPERAARLRPALLWCHGGGFALGSVDSTDAICRTLARASGALVVSVRYRLTPEHDLLAGREDFMAALRWVAQHGESIGIDTARLAVGGDSAGGNIAAAAAQRFTREAGQPLRLQLLVYPATDLRRDFPSRAENAHGYFLTADFIDWSKSLMDKLDLADPWLSPAASPDLKGLPPALVVTAGFDPIRDDGLTYVARLREAGVPVELLHYGGQIHGFLNMDSVLGAARDALARIGASLAAAFAAPAEQVAQLAPDRTLEIGDARPQVAQPLREAARKWAGASLMFWTSVGQWNGALLRLAAPRAGAAAALALQPWLRSMAWGRDSAVACLQRLEVRQTHPASSAD